MEKHTQEQAVNTAHNHQPKTFSKGLVLMVLIVIVLGVISLLTGAYDIFGQEDGWEMFLITRIPRTAALMLTGAAMSLSGVVMQLLTQNRFAEPTTTGTIEWSGLGLLLVYYFVPNPTILQRMTGAIIFAFIGTVFFFYVIRKIKLRSSLMLPIIGIMLGAVVSAISTFLGMALNMMQPIETWFQGSFAPVQRGRYEYLYIIIILTVIIFKFADRLTIAGLGEDIATNLGLNYRRITTIGVIIVSVIVGIVSSVIGQLPFLGLLVPNIVTMFRGDNLRSNLPWVCLVGMATLTACDIISRTIIEPFEVPVSLILGTIGSLV